jgi:hypothetical protein
VMIRDEVLMIDLGTIDLLFLLIIGFHALALAKGDCAFMTL